MKYVFAFAVVIACAATLIAEPPKDKEAKPPALAKVVVVAAKIESGGSTFLGVGGKNISARYIKVIVTDKVWLQAGWSIDRNKPDAKEKGEKLDQALKESKKGGPCAIDGELMWEDDSPTLRFAHIWYGQNLSLDKKNVDLVIHSITKIDDKNKALYPEPGKVRVQGKAVCGQRDLKLVEEPTLALENGKLPIVLDGDKGKADAKAKGIIQATGTVSMDKKGFLRLLADEVKNIKE